MKNIKVINDPNTALTIADKAIELIVDNPKNISVIRNADKDYIRNFVMAVSVGEIPEYIIIGFYDDEELVGACLLSQGNPWYDPNIRILNEEFTISFKRGAGIARRLAAMMTEYLKQGHAEFVQTGSVNDWCAPMLKNSYKKAGFHIYNQYYLSKEDLDGKHQEGC